MTPLSFAFQLGILEQVFDKSDTVVKVVLINVKERLCNESDCACPNVIANQ
jgi:hypothetical protein